VAVGLKRKIKEISIGFEFGNKVCTIAYTVTPGVSKFPLHVRVFLRSVNRYLSFEARE
jgi:hypothetical protein